ncbi:MAG TPA: CDP-glycerol glycerophosphotransferase family protein [Thermoplasmata archaeon]|nr:CDP-glycerol glycerophosphotransferase family protein [Thermoplasmata archaeon]
MAGTETSVRHTLRRIIKQPILDGKSIIELSVLDGVALWWFMDLEFETALRGKAWTGVPRGRPLLRFYGYAFYEMIASIWSRLRIPHPTAATVAGRILLVSQHTNWREILDPGTGQRRKADEFFHRLIAELRRRERTDIVSTYLLNEPANPLSKFRTGMRIALEKRKLMPEAPFVPLERFWSIRSLRAGVRARREFTRTWKKVKAAPKFRALLAESGPLAKELEARLEYYFLVAFGRMAEQLESANSLVRAVSPSAVFLYNEYGRAERALLIAARRAGILSIAVQHGIITPEHYGYMFARSEVDQEGRLEAPFVPLADVTAVYGPFYHRILTNTSAYPPTSVEVTGQPRYDLLTEAGRVYSKDGFRQKLGIRPEEKIVLWLGAIWPLPEEEFDRNVAAFARAAGGDPLLRIIVKPHPSDTDVSVEKAQRKFSGLTDRAIFVDRAGDTFEALHSCDLMVTKNSTTGIEAAAMGKPVVVLNLSGTSDTVDFVRQGIARGIYREEDLGPAVRELLADDSSLRANRARFVEEFLYRIDGKAAERVAEIAFRRVAGFTSKS